jgi:hypothetical protein
MPLILAIIAGSIIWVVSWAFGLKGFDGFLAMLLIILGTATVTGMAQYLPGNRNQDEGSSDPAPFT